MRSKGHAAFVGLLIVLTAAPPVIHFTFGGAIKAQQKQADKQFDEDAANGFDKIE